jgi:hypothetical protein
MKFIRYLKEIISKFNNNGKLNFYQNIRFLYHFDIE